MARERDVRNAIRDALLATNAFGDAVWITGLPEDSGSAASDLLAAAIEPQSTNLNTGWDAQTDGGLCYSSTVTVTLLARNDDAQLRDEQAEQLLDVLANAVNGVSLAGITLPGKTYVSAWAWRPAMAPERRIAATVSFQYLVLWEGWDTTT